jgi:hypothetical protein
METVSCSETLYFIYLTILRRIQEDGNLHIHLRENVESYKENEIVGICSKHGEMRNANNILVRNTHCVLNAAEKIAMMHMAKLLYTPFILRHIMLLHLFCFTRSLISYKARLHVALSQVIVESNCSKPQRKHFWCCRLSVSSFEQSSVTRSNRA